MFGIQNAIGIGAHFDDVDLGCGGTLARIASEGGKAYKVTLTDNVTEFSQMNIKVDFESSRADSSKACEILGITEIHDIPVQRCNELIYSTELMQNIEKVVFDKKIDTVFIHFNSDFNQDHIAASQLALTASRHVRNIFYFQSNGYILESSFYPTIFFDVSDFAKKKEQALRCYRGDHDRFNRLFDVSLKRNDVWGYANKVAYAEGFLPVKMCI